MQPRVFIGSASESLPIAEYIQRQVDSFATIHLWNQEIFKAGDYTLERLLKDYTEFDFAIFIMEPVDTAAIRGQETHIARDNVLFEAGLFFGHLGRDRTLLVAPSCRNSSPRFQIPSDLAGLTLITYNPFSASRDLPAKLGPVCTKTKEVNRGKGRATDRQIDKRMNVLSGGMVYILRHLDCRILDLPQIAAVLMAFNGIIKNSDRRKMPLDKKVRAGWEKAAQYASQTLDALGLATEVGTFDCHACKITDDGRALVNDATLRQLFQREVNLPLVSF